MLSHTLAIDEVKPIISRPVYGLFVHNAAQHGNSSCGKSRRQWARFACDNWIAARVCSENSDGWVDVHCLVFVEAKGVHVFHFHDRIFRRRPLISDVKLMGYWI